MNIPLPSIGYWSKIKHGKPEQKKELPEQFEGESELIIEDEKANNEKSPLKKWKKEIADFKEWLDQAKRWKEAKLIREYLEHIQSNTNQNNTSTQEIKDWILWARDKAAWYDPLINKEDEILGLYKND